MKWFWDGVDIWIHSNHLWKEDYLRVYVYSNGETFVYVGRLKPIPLNFKDAQEAMQELEGVFE